MIHHNLDQATVVKQSLQLTETHYGQITIDRGIDRVWAQASCQSADIDKASIILGYPAKSPGIAFIGDGLQFQFKPDEPWGGKDGKTPKYRSPVGEYDAFLPKHPTDKGYWEIESLKNNCWRINDHPYVLITEGVFKAIAGCSNGFSTIALMGVSMGLTPKDKQGKRYLVPVLQKYAEAGLGFIIAFDADAKTNKDIRWEEEKLTKELLKFNVPVLSATGLWNIEDGKGMDDFIQNKGIEEFRQILAKAYTIESRDTVDGCTSSEKTKLPSARQTSAILAEDYSQKWKFSNEQKCWRAWTGKEWEKVEDGDFRSLLKVTIDAKRLDYKGSSYITDVLSLLTDDLRMSRWRVWDRARYINFSNLVLDNVSGKTLEHSSGMGFTSHLPYHYKLLAGDTSNAVEVLQENCPHIYQWMSRAMKGDRKKMLKLLAVVNGLLRFRFHDLQMFVHLVGSPGTGKGTFSRLLMKVVGRENWKGCKLAGLNDGSKMASRGGRELTYH